MTRGITEAKAPSDSPVVHDPADLRHSLCEGPSHTLVVHGPADLQQSPREPNAGSDVHVNVLQQVCHCLDGIRPGYTCHSRN